MGVASAKENASLKGENKHWQGHEDHTQLCEMGSQHIGC